MYPERYSQIINACCLEKDLEMMDFGDKTEIGERRDQSQWGSETAHPACKGSLPRLRYIPS